jgi:glycosyltransferase involved in cell wall biosynthesis
MPTRGAIRVLRVITRLNIGGPSIQAIELTTRLPPLGYQTLLAHGVPDAGEGDMSYLLENRPRGEYDVVQVPSLRRPIALVGDLRAVRQLFRVIRRFRPAIVHTHMAKAGTVGRLATIAYNRTVPRVEQARLVHTYHGHVLEGYFSPAKTRLFIGIERALARATDRIVAVSPLIRDELLNQHRIGVASQYRVVPLGLDLEAFAQIDDRGRRVARAALGIAAAAHVVATVGRLTAIKQHGLFLEAATLVAERDAAAQFLIVGDGELRGELEKTARERGLADRVQFLGWRPDLVTIYGAADVLLLTSRNEGTPVALIESLAAGVPGVSTDVGGVRDVIQSSDIGLLAPFADARALAHHVVSLLADPARRSRMGEAGRRSVVARYGLERLADDVVSCYRELLH